MQEKMFLVLTLNFKEKYGILLLSGTKA